MYLFQQLKKIVRGATASPVTRYRLTEVEIDNPVSESKICVPAFEVVPLDKPAFADLDASSFGLDVLLSAGVQLKPSTIVTTNFLRDTEKFMNSVQNSKN